MRGALAQVLAPNRDLITTSGDAVIGDPTQPSEIVEFTKNGEFVGQSNVDAGQRGAFGIGIATTGTNTARLAVVEDNANDIICDRSEPLTGRLISLQLHLAPFQGTIRALASKGILAGLPGALTPA